MRNESMEDTKEQFEKSFLEGSYYKKQTEDERHKKLLLGSLHIYEDSKVLDLGTGTGYLAFALAEQRKDCNVVGIDIVRDTLKRNKERARNEHRANLEFLTYDGTNLPFENNTFDAVISRYVLHHIEHVEDVFHEIFRVLKPGGQLMLADPMPDRQDTDHFIDKYMRIKKDGHQKFYTKEEVVALAKKAGLIVEASRYTKITFPRKKSIDVINLLETTDIKYRELYQISVTNDEVYITTDVLNISFFKG